MKQPLVSITIPTYNRAHLLLETLNILCKQIERDGLHEDVELVISDNGSTDATEQIVKRILDESKFRIVYNRNSENVGVIRNILKLVEFSSGKYWMFYGDDDVIPEGGLKKLVEVYRTTDGYPAYMFRWPDSFDQFCKHLKMDVDMSFDELASGYFYYIGNAGIFAVETQRVKEIIEKYPGVLLSTCWPQTIMVFLAIFSSQKERIRFVNLVSAVPPTDALVSSNCYYLFETSIYAMLRTALSLEAITKKEIVVQAMKTVPVIQDFERLKVELIQNYCFYDLPKHCTDFKRAVKEAHMLIPKEHRKEIDALYRYVSLPLIVLKWKFYLEYYKKLNFSTINTGFVNKLKIASPFGFKAMVDGKRRRIAESKKILKKTEVASDSGYF